MHTAYEYDPLQVTLILLLHTRKHINALQSSSVLFLGLEVVTRWIVDTQQESRWLLALCVTLTLCFVLVVFIKQ